MSTGMADANPTIGSYKPERAAPRERVLSNGELVKIWSRRGGGDFAIIVRLLMLLGLPAREIGKLAR